MRELLNRCSLLSLIVLMTAGLAVSFAGCGDDDDDDDDDTAKVAIMNDFNNTEFDYQPPWHICESSYGDTEFGEIALGDTSDTLTVDAGLDYVLMVAAWDDTTCDPDNCLPIASRNEEEVVPGQTRTIEVNMPNHQGPCPPEGTEPIPEDLYNRILDLWPDYGFLPYDRRTENTECLE